MAAAVPVAAAFPVAAAATDKEVAFRYMLNIQNALKKRLENLEVEKQLIDNLNAPSAKAGLAVFFKETTADVRTAEDFVRFLERMGEMMRLQQ